MATGNILTDSVATYTGNAWNVAATGSDAESAQNTIMTHHGWNNSRVAFNDINDWFAGTKNAGTAGANPVFLGGLEIREDLTLASNDPTLTLGNGLGGGAMLDLRKLATRELRGPSYLNGTVRMFEWVWQSDERLEFRSLDAAGANPLDIWSIAANVAGVSNITFLGGVLNMNNVAVFPTAATTVLGASASPWASLTINDGITAPGTPSTGAVIYVDTADGDLKVKFSDGFVGVIAADS